MSIYSKAIDLQKLNQAWEKVRKNKPACGVDNVTWEMYDNNKVIELKELHMELVNQTYACNPVRLTTIYKEDKARTIALYCMRDKVIQQSLASELTKIYDSMFSKSTYAYRPNKSALAAIEEINRLATSKEYQYALKIDIHHFFDEINCVALKKILVKRVIEDDVVDLIMKAVTTRSISIDGELVEKKLGIYQGSALAPILSNIYLMKLDRDMEQNSDFYLRYSDDILFLLKDEVTAQKILQSITVQLESLQLQINEKKTRIVRIEEGFDFLGYHFGAEGKAIPQKAKDNLESRLESMWLLENKLSFAEKIKKGKEILGGWEQYFRENEEPRSLYEIVVLTNQVTDEERFKIMREQRVRFRNYMKDICIYLTEFWEKHEDQKMQMFEYEQYFELDALDKDIAISSIYLDEILSNYKKLLIHEEQEYMENILQAYADASCYNKASKFSEILTNFQSQKNVSGKPIINMQAQELKDVQLSFTSAQIREFMNHFVGREDLYAVEQVKKDGQRVYESVFEPITEEVIKKHLLGEITIATYVQRANLTTSFMTIDIDISKKVLLKLGDNQDQMVCYMQKAAQISQDYVKVLAQLGVTAYVEESGYRGYHIWVLFSEWIPTRYINMLQDILENKVKNEDEDISVEFFPNKTRIKPGKFGQAIKLPYGIHMKTFRRSILLDENYNSVKDVGSYICELATYSAAAVKQILGKQNIQHREAMEQKIVDTDLSSFGDLPETISVVLEKCTLMRYLCQKSRTTGYLSHFERLSLLYVFGHMGDDGAAFLHQIMSYTLNYQYNITQKFINKVPAKPISCLKLRDQYPKITAEYGCNCNFNKAKGCYPSPVLYAIKSTTDEHTDITLPVSKTLSKEKESKICDSLNTNKNVQALVTKVLEYKKQKRAIDKNIVKLEKELEKIFDENHVECMEVEFGLLVRRKKEDGYEWIVEI